MFEINNKNFIQYEINGTTVYEIQDFYKYPDKIVDFISNILPRFHKEDQYPSLNGYAFEDLRHSCQVIGMREVSSFLSNICKQRNDNENTLSTNMFKFLDKNFNRYNDNYWWPHIDFGYTALIYLNSFSYPGTNLYTSLVGESHGGNEHLTPWQPKSNYKLEKTLYAKYNKLVLFDGLVNSHSMAITDDRFYDNYRLNQVLFFKKEKIHKSKFEINYR